jgi:hypothetical protein
MKKLGLIAAICIVPATLMAQDTSAAGGQDSSRARGRVAADARSQGRLETGIPASISADVRARLEVVLQKASERALPVQAIENRIAEGVAKGASEAQIILAASALEGRLEATQSAMFRAGRPNPSDGEVTSGASAMEHGASAAHIEVLATHAPSDRSLVVAFDVLSALAADGKPVAQALAQIQAKLDARAPDATIAAMGGIGVTAFPGTRGSAASNPPAAASPTGVTNAANGVVRGAVQVTAGRGGGTPE